MRQYEAKGRRAAKAANEYKAQVAELTPKLAAAEAEVDGLKKLLAEVPLSSTPILDADEALQRRIDELEAALALSDQRCSAFSTQAQEGQAALTKVAELELKLGDAESQRQAGVRQLQDIEVWIQMS